MLRDVTVTQGVGAYAKSVWGKESVARAHLSKPSCAASTDTITLTGASLAVSKVNGIVETPLGTVAAPVQSLKNASLPPFSQAPLPDHPADPLWVVPAAMVAPPGTEATGFTAGFTATLSFQSATHPAGTIAFSTSPSTGLRITRAFERRTNPARILGAALGAPLGSTGQSALNASLVNLNNKLPVQTGVTDLTGNGGVRFTLSPTVVNLGPTGLNVLDSNGKFCGTSGNFDPIKNELAGLRQAWNAANPSATADFVVGLVDEGIVATGCATFGLAAIASNESWVRLTASGTPTAGATMAMEIGHNLGLVPPVRYDLADPWHSKAVQADAGTDRAYNVAARSWLSTDKTVMNLTPSPWDNSNTLFEAADWAFALCRLGGEPAGDCGVSGTVGATSPATNLLFIEGTTDGTVEGSDIETWRDSGTIRGEVDPASQYRLIGREAPGGPAVEDIRLPVRFDSGHAGGDGEPADGVIDASFEFDPAAAVVEVWKGEPGASGSVLLHSSVETGTPQVLSVAQTPDGPGEANWSNDAVHHDRDPALSVDGEWLAWVRQRPAAGGGCPAGGGVLVAAPVDDPGAATTFGECETPPPADPTWRADGAALAFTKGGNLWTVRFDRQTGIFSDPRRVYQCTATTAAGACISTGDGLPLTRAAADPSFSKDANAAEREHLLAFEEGGDVYVVEAYDPAVQTEGISLFNTNAVASEGLFEGEPSFSPAGPGERLAYRRGVRDIYTVDARAAAPAATRQLLVTGGTNPAWGGGPYLTFTGGSIWISDSRDAEAAKRAITHDPSDTEPSYVGAAGGTVAFQRTLGGQDEIFLLGFEEGNEAYVARVRDDNREDGRGQFFADCEGLLMAVAAGLDPQLEPGDPNVARYILRNFDESWMTCAGAVMRARAHDQFSISGRVSPGAPTGSQAKDPSVAIYTPTSETRISQTRAIALAGQGYDAEGRVLGDPAHTWFLSGPGLAEREVGTGRSVDASPPGGSWTPGLYTARLVARDGGGRTAEASVSFAVVGEVSVDFDPNTFYVPSSGHPVSMKVSSSTVDLSRVVTARIVSLQGETSGPVAVSINSESWKNNEAKFSRQTLSKAFEEAGLVGQRALVTLVGCSDRGCQNTPYVFEGADPAAPRVTRA